MVKGPLVPVPAVAYLGVVVSGQVTDETILLKPSQAGIQLTDIHSPEGVTANVGTPNEVGDLPLYIHWRGGNHLGAHMGTDYAWDFGAP